MLAKCVAITEATKALKLPQKTIERTIERVGVEINGRKKIKRKFSFVNF